MRILFSILSILVAASSYAATDFSGIDLRTLKSVSVSREDKASLATVIVFVSSKCPCSDSHVKELVKLNRDYPKFRILAVNSNADETNDVAHAYFKEKALPFPVLRDADQKLADEFKAYKTPHAYVLGPNGEKLFQGGVTDSAQCDRAGRFYLREALDDIAAAKKVRTPLARALGCVIERKSER